MRRRIRLSGRMLTAVAAFLGYCAPAFAAGIADGIEAGAPDPRFIVELHADPEAGLTLAGLHADIRMAARKALPVLWRRVVPAADLPRAPSAAQALRLLRRAIPTADGVRIEFDKARTRAMLEKEGVGFIADAPRWAVSLRLSDWRGRPMRRLERALQQRLGPLMEALGIVADPAGEPLALTWTWLGPTQAALRVRGPAGETAETRWLGKVGAEEADVQEVARWMEEALMRARDALAAGGDDGAFEGDAAMPAPVTMTPAGDPYASDPYANDPYAMVRATPSALRLASRLTVEDDAGLADRVMFEEALRRQARVASVTPEWLDAVRRVYRVRLRRPGDAWLGEWLRQRGFAVERDDAGGWLAHRP